MRTIGSIERFLVVGIVIVIGAILTVAIKGARDWDREYENQVAAKSKGNDPKANDSNKVDPSAKGDPKLKGDPKSARPSGAMKRERDGTRTGTGSTSLRNESTLQPDGGVGADPKLTDPKLADPKLGASNPGNQSVNPASATLAGDPSGAHPSDTQPSNPAVADLLRKQQDALNGRGLDGGSNARLPLAGADPAAGAGAAALRSSHSQGSPESSGHEATGEAADSPVVIDESKVEAGGKTPPKNAANSAAEYYYVVQPGDALQRIARAVYDDVGEWKEILAANPTIGDGNTIKPLANLRLPKAPTQPCSFVIVKEVATIDGGVAPNGAAQKGGSSEKGNPRKDAATPVASAQTAGVDGDKKAAAAFKRITSTEQLTVVRGDTLSSIALQHYGTKAAWKLIYDANADHIPDKDRIKVDVVLRLPAN